MSRLRSICVFCGSSPGSDPAYLAAARALGAAMGREGLTLVFGAGNVGLMGATATAAIAEGGRVVGVIPEHLTRVETPHGELMELHVVESMHVRKRLMFERSDAICVLPGGLGTLDETFEILTWKQLGLHEKPVIFLNINGYWDPLLGLIDAIVAQGFARPSVRALYTVVDGVEAIIPAARQGLPEGDLHLESPTSERF
ncbi:TIGR00730 family Rossman fold protein [Rhodospirillum rubrum]|uniref:LOG family protein n=1 Tax=Rhodospirillum rubrum TaxID=1085 RepID=UPI001907AE6C|nr:TIGR00730 family Rossman fold protein [Rhodospirillum rubrum]MBK1663720.1 TIGR00730 family Rossman fold protein [Rhodospirillum rubrum]MBK1676471.1 TIGR00730 family Rossman fold protein [Rhodospirillum rubrum]